MAFIYKITNTINDKVYVGQTVRPIEVRFRQHVQDSKKVRITHSKLYHAMNKYGTDKFCVELIETCERANLDEREIYWIQKLNSFHNGYNTTTGGKGHGCDCTDEVKKLWESGMLIEDIHNITGHARDTVRYCLEAIGVPDSEIKERAYKSQSAKVKVPVYQYDFDGNYVGEYASVWDAEKETGIHHTCITGVMCGNHNVAGNYQWRRYKVDKIEPCNNKRRVYTRPVHKYAIDGTYLETYANITKACEAHGLLSTHPISRVCNGTAHTSVGFRWSYELVDKLPPLRQIRKNQYNRGFLQ